MALHHVRNALTAQKGSPVPMSLSQRWNAFLLVAGILATPAGQAVAADFCDFVVKQAPAVLGSAIGTPQRHVSGEICLVAAADKKSWLTARIKSAAQAATLVADVRKQHETLKAGSIFDEPSLGAGAWRAVGERSVVFSFASGERFMLVEMWRDGGPTNADVAKVREFAKAFAKQ